jgi:hypothetical protein
VISDRQAPPASSERAVPTFGQPFNPYKRFPGAQVPEGICRYKGLSPGAKLVYGRLCRYAGEDGAAYPSMSTLAEEVGMGETQAREYVKELEVARFLCVDRENRHYRKDGSGGSNNYVFLWHAAFSGDTGQFRKAPPPLRKTGGVPHRKTVPPTPSVDRTRRESVSRESVQESHSTHDYQPTNRKLRDSRAGVGVLASDENPQHQGPTPKPSSGSARRYPAAELDWMADALNRYGRGPTMSEYMQESAPPAIVQKCLAAADGASLDDIGQILRHRCLNGCDPGRNKGPRGWGWFPTVITNATRSWRDQEAAAKDPSLRRHWSEFNVAADPAMPRAVSAFSTLDVDDLEATA